METEEHSYCRRIEDAFIRLRGSPLLLSPADWRTAMRWWKLGIPVDFVVSSLEEVFERRRSRGQEAKVNGLRYCASQVEGAWSDARELLGPVASPVLSSSLDVRTRLSILASSLPVSWSATAALRQQLEGVSGSSESVEAELARLDAEMLERAAGGLSCELLAEVSRRVAERLEPLAARLEPSELRRVEARLHQQEVRRHLGLPFLSLFSADAEGRE